MTFSFGNVLQVFGLFSLDCQSVQYGDAAVSHCTRWQQRGAKRMGECVEHSTGVWLIEQQCVSGPVQQHTDPLGTFNNL